MLKLPPLAAANGGHVHSRTKQLERAAHALQMERFDEAEQLAAGILRASRFDIPALSILARALIGQKRGAEAIMPLEKAARRGDDPGIETLLGLALADAGRRAKAIEQFRRTAQRRPPFIPAFLELARQLAKDGSLEEAIVIIESGIQLAPQNIDMKLYLARLYLHRNERGKARAILMSAHDSAPGRPEILTALARVLLLDGEYASAADTYRRALGLRPDDALTRADLAACLLEMGQRDAGEESLRSAVRGGAQMLGRATFALVNSSHGRFFFRQSAVAKFLQDKTT